MLGDARRDKPRPFRQFTFRAPKARARHRHRNHLLPRTRHLVARRAHTKYRFPTDPARARIAIALCLRRRSGVTPGDVSDESKAALTAPKPDFRYTPKLPKGELLAASRCRPLFPQ